MMPGVATFFCGDFLQHGVVEHGFGQQLLQLGVLVHQCPQPLGLGHLQAAVRRLSLVEGGLRDTMAADLGGLLPRFLLPQGPNDLLLAEPAFLHPWSSWWRTLLQLGDIRGEQVKLDGGTLANMRSRPTSRRRWLTSQEAGGGPAHRDRLRSSDALFQLASLSNNHMQGRKAHRRRPLSRRSPWCAPLRGTHRWQWAC